MVLWIKKKASLHHSGWQLQVQNWSRGHFFCPPNAFISPGLAASSWQALCNQGWLMIFKQVMMMDNNLCQFMMVLFQPRKFRFLIQLQYLLLAILFLPLWASWKVNQPLISFNFLSSDTATTAGKNIDLKLPQDSLCKTNLCAHFATGLSSLCYSHINNEWIHYDQWLDNKYQMTSPLLRSLQDTRGNCSVPFAAV